MHKSYFEPQELTVLTAVLQRACLVMRVVDNSQREDIAVRIIRLAQTGEWDSVMPAKGPTIFDFLHFFESLHAELSEKRPSNVPHQGRLRLREDEQIDQRPQL
jgi:hypothetical protein